MNADREQDYLWDRSGPPDPDVVRLEEMLGAFRHRAPVPPLPDRHPATARGRRVTVKRLALYGLAAAAVICLAAGGWFIVAQFRGWEVETLAGVPNVDGEALSGPARLTVGKWLETDAGARARIAVGRIGRVEVEPNSRVQLLTARGREHRISLIEGTITAQIWAPPGFFYVNTPSAVAIDLGCAYTLTVDADGAGLLRVTQGWVGFQYGGREAFIPQHAICATRPGLGPGSPRYEDAPDGFAAALDVLDFGAADDPGRAAALGVVLDRARPRDALTLWHLLTRVSAGERTRVYDRMAVLRPPPAGVTREAVLAGDKRAIDRWWDSLGLDSTTWWRLWKKQW